MSESELRFQARRVFDELWDYDNPTDSEARFLAYLDEHGDSISSDERLELQTQIARTFSLRREFDMAHQILDDVELKLTGNMPVASVRYFLERGRTFNSARELDQARTSFAEALRVSQAQGCDGYAVDAAHMIAITHGENPDEALKWNRAAIELAESSADPAARRWRGSLWNNMGWAYFTREQFDLAHECFQRVVQHRQEEGTASELHHARWCLARCKRSLGFSEEALVLQQELLTAKKAIGETDGFVYEEIAECLHRLNQEDEAKPYFRKAHELLSRDPWLAEHEPVRLQRLSKLGDSS